MAEAPTELLQRVPLFADFDRGDLERLSRSFKERTFEAGSHVVDEGKGPAVLLLHGFPDSSYLWRHQIRALAQAGYRVIAV